MTEHPTDAQIDAGVEAWRNTNAFTDVVECVSRIYLAMEAAKPSTPIDDEGLVEKVAKAIFVTAHPTGDWAKYAGQRRYVKQARAAIKAIRASNVS